MRTLDTDADTQIGSTQCKNEGRDWSEISISQEVPHTASKPAKARRET